MDWSNQHDFATHTAEALELGALRAVLAAAERLGVAQSSLLAAAAAESAGLSAADRAALSRLSRVPARAATSDAFFMRARTTMAKLVAERRCRVADVAKELAVSARTLQRRLEKAGTTFVTLWDETRRIAALEQLRNPEVAIKETAFRLGFSEPSTFYRAFRRWTGDTPANYRRSFASLRLARRRR